VSPQLIVAIAIVVLSSAGFLVVGAAYRWNPVVPGYGRWTRVIGVVALLGLAGTAAWGRAGSPWQAAAIVGGGLVLAAVFVVVHARLSDHVREAFGAHSPDADATAERGD
jgi:uncharacterized membrane protein